MVKYCAGVGSGVRAPSPIFSTTALHHSMKLLKQSGRATLGSRMSEAC
jgi:hypothetical protein